MSDAAVGGIGAVVFDLDGVIRHYDRVRQRAIEVRHGLGEGSLFTAAFGGSAGRRFMRGEIDHDEFAMAIGESVGSQPAAVAFLAERAAVDREMVELILAVRQRVRVALLTNGSRRTRAELDESGLTHLFDHIGNSAETALPKPEAGAYLHVLDALGVDPSAAVFVDDHLPNIEGAERVGMVGHHYTGVGTLAAFLGWHGVIDADRRWTIELPRYGTTLTDQRGMAETR